MLSRRRNPRLRGRLVEIEPQPLGDRSWARFIRNGFGARATFDPGPAHQHIEPLAAGVAARGSKTEQRHQPAEALAASAIQGMALAIGAGKSWRQHRRLRAACVASAVQAMVLVPGAGIGPGPRARLRLGFFVATRQARCLRQRVRCTIKQRDKPEDACQIRPMRNYGATMPLWCYAIARHEASSL